LGDAAGLVPELVPAGDRDLVGSEADPHRPEGEDDEGDRQRQHEGHAAFRTGFAVAGGWGPPGTKPGCPEGRGPAHQHVCHAFLPAMTVDRSSAGSFGSGWKWKTTLTVVRGVAMKVKASLGFTRPVSSSVTLLWP